MSPAVASSAAVAAESRAPAGLSGSPFAAANDPGALVGLGRPTDLSACLLPLLAALGWRGHPQQVAEALPHFLESFDITAFRNVMATLGYLSVGEPAELDAIEPEMTPCLFVADAAPALVLVSRDGNAIEAFDVARLGYGPVPDEGLHGDIYTFTPLHGLTPVHETEHVDWFRSIAERFRGLARQAFAITFLLALLNLATPLFVMVAFDRALVAGSAASLAFLAVGVGIAVLCECALRAIRTRVFSFVGARLDNIVGVEVFRKTLQLPLAQIEKSTVGAHVARIRDFEAAREFFTGPSAPMLLELPFGLVFIAAIAVIGDWIAFIPLVVIGFLVALGWTIKSVIAKRVVKAVDAAADMQELTVETLGDVKAIKYSGAEAIWLKRYRTASAEAALQVFQSAQISSLLGGLAYVLCIAAGFALAAFGALKVEAGTMTLGGLAAALILAWRALAPAQAAMVAVGRYAQVENGIDRLNALMDLKADTPRSPTSRALTSAKGRVTFANVTKRYDPELPPALQGVNIEMKKGHIIAVLGGNGAGKSTLIKLLAGMYQPEEGTIMIDDRNIHGMNPHDLREAVSFVPQTPQFFYGTIAQNLRLAHPTASDADLRWATIQAGALEDIEELTQGSGEWRRTGFDVRLGDSGAGQVSPGLLQRLNLARGYLKRSPIMLLDEPGSGLDAKGDQALMRALANLRGRTTVFIVTHRPSHLKMADRMIWLENGKVRSIGKPQAVLPEAGAMP